MSVPSNKDLSRRWFEEVWNKRRSEAIDEMFAADGWNEFDALGMFQAAGVVQAKAS